MKVFTALVLTIATLAAAAPSPNGEVNASTLDTRQNVPGCVYSCLCQLSGEGEPEVDPDTATCCSAVGGNIENDNSVCPPSPARDKERKRPKLTEQKQVCSGLNWDTAHIYGDCCGDTGGWICGRNERDCPIVGA